MDTATATATVKRAPTAAAAATSEFAEQIAAIAVNARAGGDVALVTLCVRAQGGDRQARIKIARLIRRHEALVLADPWWASFPAPRFRDVIASIVDARDAIMVAHARRTGAATAAAPTPHRGPRS